MIFVWDTWFDTDFKEGKYNKNDFALMPIFMGGNETGTYEGGNFNMFMINKKSTKIEKARKFLEFCATPENYNIAFDGIATNNVFNNQTTNVISSMVSDVKISINKNLHPSTAIKIHNYNPSKMTMSINTLLDGSSTLEQCLDELSAQIKE